MNNLSNKFNPMNEVFENLLEYITKANISFRHVQHAPTFTSEESAKARGESLEVGAKAMLMKADDQYVLFVLSAAKKIDSKKVKSLLRTQSLRFASAEELFALTALVPGSVPPFGRPILPFPLYVDESIQNLPYIAFNAGSLTNSIIMNTKDYLGSSHGTLCAFSR
jgi:Ala-tRNA(Pro) deacylase